MMFFGPFVLIWLFFKQQVPVPIAAAPMFSILSMQVWSAFFLKAEPLMTRILLIFTIALLSAYLFALAMSG